MSDIKELIDFYNTLKKEFGEEIVEKSSSDIIIPKEDNVLSKSSLNRENFKENMEKISKKDNSINDKKIENKQNSLPQKKNSENILTRDEKIVLKAVEVLTRTYGIPEYFFNLSGYKENTYCIQKINKKWVFYYAQKNQKFEYEEFSNIKKACTKLLSTILLKDNREKGLKDFNELLRRFCITFKDENPIKIKNDTKILIIDNTFKEIKPFQFADNDKIKYLAVTADISIGGFAFLNCKNLEYVTIQNNKDFTDDELKVMFEGCENIKYILVNKKLRKF